jgi:hypothetical protein
MAAPEPSGQMRDEEEGVGEGEGGRAVANRVRETCPIRRRTTLSIPGLSNQNMFPGLEADAQTQV